MTELIEFWLFVALCFLVFCIGLGLALIGWWQIKRDDVMIVSDQVDRETIKKFLKLDTKQKDQVDAELTVRVDDD